MVADPAKVPALSCVAGVLWWLSVLAAVSLSPSDQQRREGRSRLS